MQLQVYTFGADAAFEGWLVNALERLESAGSLRVVDVLFVQTDAASGEATAFDGGGAGLSTMLVPLIDFRLDPAARRRATEDALADPAVRELVGAMEPGHGLAAALLEHRSGSPLDVAILDEAVSRASGTPVVSKPVDARRLSELTSELRAVRSDR